jgi:DNA-binding CsgD family transcriptional regulator
MIDLPHATHQKLLTSIHDLHSVATLEQFPSLILDTIEPIVGSDASYCVSFQGPTIEFIAKDLSFDPSRANFTPAYFQQHPVLTHHLQTNDWSAFKCSDFLTETAYHRQTALYEYAYEQYDIEDFFIFSIPDRLQAPNPKAWSLQSIVCEPDIFARVQYLSQQHHTLGNLSIHINRYQRNFTEADRTLLNLLQPHIHSAYRNLQHWAALQSQIDQLTALTEFVGIITLSPDRQIQQLTQQAVRLLEQYFPDEWIDRHQLPESLHQYCQQAIATVLQADLGNPLMPPLERFQNNCRLIIRLIAPPQTPEILLTLEEYVTANLSIESFRAIGLTKRESEIMFYLTEGKTNKEIAAQLNRKPLTIKTHLDSIYAKLNAHDRTQAVAIALAQLGMMSGT